MNDEEKELLRKWKLIQTKLRSPKTKNSPFNIGTVLNLAIQEGVLYAYASNHGTYELRWSINHPIEHYLEPHVIPVVIDRIMALLPLVEEVPETDENEPG